MRDKRLNAAKEKSTLTLLYERREWKDKEWIPDKGFRE